MRHKATGVLPCEQHVVRRSIELNAKRIGTIRHSTRALWAVVCLVVVASVLPAAILFVPVKACAQSAEGQRLTRGDVDNLLVDARKAIADGNLDQAEVLVERAEASGIRYPLLHFGATPSKVRFELTRAQQAAGVDPSTKKSTDKSETPAKDTPADGKTDPFAVRQPAQSETAGGGAYDNLSLSSSREAANGLTVDNPFRTNADGPSTPPMSANFPDAHSNGLLRQPLGLSGTGPDIPSSTADSQMAPTSGPNAVVAWVPPDAPLPPHLEHADKVGDLSSHPASMAQTAASPAAKGQALDLLAQSRQALDTGNVDLAETLVQKASALGVPESQFLPNEDRPSYVAWDIAQARARQSGVHPADRIPTNTSGRQGSYAEPAQYLASTQSSGEESTIKLAPPQTNVRVSQLPKYVDTPEQAPSPLPTAPTSQAKSPFGDDTAPYAGKATPLPESLPSPFSNNDAAMFLREGEAALEQSDRETARDLFEQANNLRDQLDDGSQRRLQKHLEDLVSEDLAAPKPSKTSSLIESAASDEQVQARQLSADVSKRQSEARRMREQNPRQAMESLQDMRKQVADSKISAEYRDQLLRRLDFSITEMKGYLQKHGSEIELNEQNQAVREDVERSREVKLKVQQKIADLVDQFNKLRDEQRYAEMEIVARRLYELAPNDEVAQQVWQNAKFIRRTIMNQDLENRKEDANWMAWNDVENSSVQDVGDGREMKYDQKHWDSLVKNRKGSQERNGRRTERELEIERRLKTPVLLRYEDAPLSEVVNGLGELAGVNIHLDPRGLSQEGVTSDTPVTINLSKEISLKSALNLILEPLHLSYVIKDEVLKITSEQLRDGELVTVTYNVADLVIPIPNFVPSNNIGLQGLMNDAYSVMGYGNGVGMPGPAVLLSDRGKPKGAAGSENLLAQHMGGGSSPGGLTSSAPVSSGPGGLGGGANADFESLIELIVSTVAADTWAENGGGEAEIREFPTNLSLVISQTQAVHEQIADLLEQLRRLQDLQVTIEVRFIRLSDNFFERIGVDFQMNIDNPGARSVFNANDPAEPFTQSVTVGLEQPTSASDFPRFTADLDIPFRQGSFNVTTPALGGFDAATAGKFGYAILSDIQAYFLIEAAQGDSRTNILNAPKVTLFNGQQAIVTDVVQMPFVIGVIPVVGEFAAAQQPVIVVLNEGTLMSIQAVVSDDRRYVRLTVVPFFTDIGNVQTFTFEGTSSSTSSSSASSSDSGDSTDDSKSDSGSTVTSGVTVQLPEFQVITVATTVSVPDGGTVLLGGIKRLSEGRKEAGIPLLSKLPYVNRLFRNVGIGRETDSLMMMVTPRIIIQEEEEDRLGIAAGP
jgi:general secretion pathway protein D